MNLRGPEIVVVVLYVLVPMLFITWDRPLLPR
jgi:hypothetical protein